MAGCMLPTIAGRGRSDHSPQRGNLRSTGETAAVFLYCAFIQHRRCGAWIDKNGSNGAQRGCTRSGHGCQRNSSPRSRGRLNGQCMTSSMIPREQRSNGSARASPVVRPMRIDGRPIPRDHLRSMKPIRG